jgi:hypothetical protein
MTPEKLGYSAGTIFGALLAIAIHFGIVFIQVYIVLMLVGLV